MRDQGSMPLDEQLAVRAARERLLHEFGEHVDVETIDAILDASWEHMDAVARVKVHVPLLAERFARAQLWAAARMRGHREAVPAVVFVDLHDAGRAPMAKALFLRRAGAAGLAFSAGTDPNTSVDEIVLRAMEELGITTTESFPKPYTPEILRAADLVVGFLGSEDVPIPVETEHEVWDVPDPRGRSLDEVRAIRDDIRGRVDALAARLGIPASGS
jgi:arsenate reductase (thioredoxin)